MASTCQKCGGPMERGFATAEGLIGGDQIEGNRSRILFVVPGTPTSHNPVQAFKQGLSGEAAVRVFAIVGDRCAHCGLIELTGLEPSDS